LAGTVLTWPVLSSLILSWLILSWLMLTWLIFAGRGTRSRAYGRPRRLCGLLLGFLLGPPFAFAPDQAPDLRYRPERLLVIRAALVNQILGSAQLLGRGQFLQ